MFWVTENVIYPSSVKKILQHFIKYFYRFSFPQNCVTKTSPTVLYVVCASLLSPLWRPVDLRWWKEWDTTCGAQCIEHHQLWVFRAFLQSCLVHQQGKLFLCRSALQREGTCDKRWWERPIVQNSLKITKDSRGKGTWIEDFWTLQNKLIFFTIYICT